MGSPEREDRIASLERGKALAIVGLVWMVGIYARWYFFNRHRGR
jgi:hypothetical protein